MAKKIKSLNSNSFKALNQSATQVAGGAFFPTWYYTKCVQVDETTENCSDGPYRDGN